MRHSIYTAHMAQYNKLLNPLSKLLTQTTIIHLAAQVQLDGLPVAQVAHDFLVKNHII